MINSSVYVFGCFPSGYMQYPEDYTNIVFENMLKSSTSQSQVVIHRERNLMYYGYTHKIDTHNNEYIGFCVLLNGIMITNISKLFDMFEKILGVLLSRKEIIVLRDGGIVSQVTSLYGKRKELDYIISLVKELLEELDYEKLPAESYGISAGIRQTLLTETNNDYVVNTAVSNDYLCVIRDKNYEYDRKYDKISKQSSPNNDRDKRSDYLAVTILTLIVSLLTNIALFDTNAKINDNLQNKEKKLVILKDSLSLANNTIDSIKQNIVKDIPLIITDVSVGNFDYNGYPINNYGRKIYSKQTMYLFPKISYWGLKSGEDVYLDIKIYKIDSIVKFNEKDNYYRELFKVKRGYAVEKLSGYGSSIRGRWKSGTYRYEFWYKDICLGTKTFTIY